MASSYMALFLSIKVEDSTKKEAVPSYAWDDSMREIQVIGDIL